MVECVWVYSLKSMYLKPLYPHHKIGCDQMYWFIISAIRLHSLISSKHLRSNSNCSVLLARHIFVSCHSFWLFFHWLERWKDYDSVHSYTLPQQLCIDQGCRGLKLAECHHNTNEYMWWLEARAPAIFEQNRPLTIFLLTVYLFFCQLIYVCPFNDGYTNQYIFVW